MTMSSVQPLHRAAFSYQQDRDVPSFDDSYWHVVMDETCGLCARAALRIARADKSDRVRIVPVGSQLGQSLMRHYGFDPHNPESWLLLREGKAFGGSSAALKLFPSLSVFYAPMLILYGLPAPWRDTLYIALARTRYRWFGRADLCAIPDPRVQARLVPMGSGRSDSDP